MPLAVASPWAGGMTLLEMRAGRRAVLFAGICASVAPRTVFAAGPPYRLFADKVRFPEGPVLTQEGALFCSELMAGTVIRIDPMGQRELIATTGGRPAGLAAGPDGAIYVANIGRPGTVSQGGFASRVQRIDPVTRRVTDVVTDIDGDPVMMADDLVFDAAGGFYFTEVAFPSPDPRSVPLTGISYFDGKAARRVTERTFATNGIGISPNGRRLYWTQYKTGRLYARDIVAPGKLAQPSTVGSDCLFSHPAPITDFDSLRVDSEGCVSVAVANGSVSGKSGIMSFSPDGKPIGFVPFPDPLTTSLALSWRGAKTAYITLGRRGEIMQMHWPRYGQKPLYTPSSHLLTASRELVPRPSG